MTKNERFKGSVNWVNRPSEYLAGIETDVKRYFTDQVVAIFRTDSDIAIDVTFRTALYTIHLTSTQPGIFDGSFTARDGSSSWQGTATARLFIGTTGRFLYGTWCENPANHVKDTWWADLLPDVSNEPNVA